MSRPRARRYGASKDVSGQRAANGADSARWKVWDNFSDKPTKYRLAVLEQDTTLLISHDIQTQNKVRELEKYVESLQRIVAQLLGTH